MEYNNNPEYYSLRPKVDKAGVNTEITIKTVCGDQNFRDEKYTVEFRPMQNANIKTFNGEEPFDRIEVIPEDGKLKFKYTFIGEQEYSILIYGKTEKEDFD